MRLTAGLSGLVLILVPILALAPVGQANHDANGFVTSTDFDPEHPPIAGVPAEVSYYLLTEGAIEGHSDSAVAFASGGAPMATIATTHEHDSIFNALVAPAREGPFHVEIGTPGGHDHAGAMRLDGGGEGAVIHAEAVPLVPTHEATLSVAGEMLMWSPGTFTFTLADADGNPLAGTILATVLLPDGQIFQQVKLAAKEGTASWTWPGSDTEVTLRAAAWPSLYSGQVFRPVALEQTLAPGTIDAASQVPAPVGLPPVNDPLGLTAAPPPEGPRLHLSNDPASSNWVMQTTRVNLVALDAMAHPLRHVDYSVRVVDLLGAVWFQSDSLHEVDGMAQVDLLFPLAGYYKVEATATPMGGEALAAEHWLRVLDVGSRPEPAAIAVTPPEALAVGAPAEFLVGLKGVATGANVPHTDYWLQMTEGGLPVLTAKLHTHEGDASALLAAPWAGDYEVRFSAYPQGGGHLGSTFTQVLTLGAAGALPPLPLQASTSDDPAPVRAAPGPEALGLLLAAGAAVLLARRRA